MDLILYRYPHPTTSGQWLYTGQGAGRDSVHRAGRSSFGRRFKKQFPNIPLPEPIRWRVLVSNHLEANEAETVAMFQYHTWRGYEGGMNLTLPGSADYKALGCLGSYEDKVRAARKRFALYGCPFTPETRAKGARRSIELHGSPHTHEGSVKGGLVGGSRAERRKNELYGCNFTSENRAKGLCRRWNINRGNPCVCGMHNDLR